jgi:oxygen-independent coproporphyrinogen-3 oxidase
MLQLPPLSLYVHLPWCVRKCPYCDFNSHQAGQNPPYRDYVTALLRDLETELPLVWGRTVHSIFLGGGTPSLFPAVQLERLVSGIRERITVSPGAEITLEANPGAAEHERFADIREAGINRVSLGVQTFEDDLLRRIGRIHGRREIDAALDSIVEAGYESANVDLMFGLPGQDAAQALSDVRLAISSGVPHISHYRLTLEPNTAFHADPPVLPDDDSCWSMQEEGASLLADSGFGQYEISAWSRPDRQCAHNVNYWRFGDYLGIGAGAHGKLTLAAGERITRRIRKRHPAAWMDGAPKGDTLAAMHDLDDGERVFEYFLNHLRLKRPVARDAFESRTGLDWAELEPRLRLGVEKGLLAWCDDGVETTDLGWRFNNETQALFLP